MLTSSDAQLLPQVEPIGPAAVRTTSGTGVSINAEYLGSLLYLRKPEQFRQHLAYILFSGAS